MLEKIDKQKREALNDIEKHFDAIKDKVSAISESEGASLFVWNYEGKDKMINGYELENIEINGFKVIVSLRTRDGENHKIDIEKIKSIIKEITHI